MCLCVVLPPGAVSALQARMAALEEELSSKAALIKSIQNEMVTSKKELAAKEISIQRASEELSLARTRMSQENERVNIQSNTKVAEATSNTSGFVVYIHNLFLKATVVPHTDVSTVRYNRRFPDVSLLFVLPRALCS